MEMERTARTRLTTAVVLAVVFSAGLLVGMAVDRSAVEPAAEVADTTRREERGRRTRMYEQVGASEAQLAQIESIVREHRGELRALQGEFRDAYDQRYQALIEQTRSAIKGVLTAEQAEAYDSLVAEYEKRRAERGSRENRD
jgi:Spy/CpxP family protein refolding chaperone